MTGTGTAAFHVSRHRLDNGLTLLVECQPSLPIVAVAAYVRCGSGEESKATSGITQLTQQMLVKGTAGRDAGEIASLIEGMGAHLHPFAGRDLSGLALSATTECFPGALGIFRDVLRFPAFPEEPLAREKAKLLSDIAALRDSSLQYTFLKFGETLFGDHPYAMPVLGQPDSISGLDGPALAAWHRAHHVPERIVMAVVGDIAAGRALELIQAHFGDLRPGSPLPALPAVDAVPRSRRAVIEKEVAQSVIVLGSPGPTRGHPDRHAIDVLMAILSGMGNRLFAELRDRQHLCYFTGAFAMLFDLGGAVGAYIGTRPENEAAAVDGLVGELRKARESLPSDEELRRAKNTIAGGYVIDLQRRSVRASLLAQEEAAGLGYEEALRYLDEIRAVTAADVRDVAARYLNVSEYTLAVLKPGPA